VIYVTEIKLKNTCSSVTNPLGEQKEEEEEKTGHLHIE
jgi:hypothetical protein